METIGHHTCRNTENVDEIERNGPFKAIHGKTGKQQFLGTGYYFWDNNIAAAKHWGKVHYEDCYLVFEANLTIPEEQFLDLVGSRKAMIYAQELMKRFKARNQNSEHWELGKFIEFMKEVANKPGFKNVFPYTVFRAVDHSITAKSEPKHLFVAGKPNYINLNPRFVICLAEKNSLVLKDFRAVYPESYAG